MKVNNNLPLSTMQYQNQFVHSQDYAVMIVIAYMLISRVSVAKLINHYLFDDTLFGNAKPYVPFKKIGSVEG